MRLEWTRSGALLGRPDGIVLGMMTKGFGSFLLGTLLGASEFSELLENNAESNADVEAWFVKSPRNVRRVPQRLLGPLVCVFWSAESEELVVIKERPVPLGQNLCFTGSVDAG